MANEKSVKTYKSNTRWAKGEWRYMREESHYMLDYRFIWQEGVWGSYSWSGYTVDYKSKDHINDLMIVARSLGFDIEADEHKTYCADMKPSERSTIYYHRDGDINSFGDLKPYKNGNIHCYLCKEFMQKLNIEVGRIRGWIKSPQDAADEMGISKKVAEAYFGQNGRIELSNIAGMKMLN